MKDGNSTMMKRLFIGGSRDGEWINDDGGKADTCCH